MQTLSKKTATKNVDEYIATFPPAVQDKLEKLRDIIKAAAPKAEEVISYQMPAYTYHGMLVYFAAFKSHIGFYPTPGGIDAFKKELSIYKSAKGSVQFPLDKPIPFELIRRIVKFRVNENEEKAAAKKTSRPAADTKSKKPTDEEQVNSWISKQTTVVRNEINAVREIIKNTSPKINERIKWNAPSYYYKNDFLTFGPYKDRILLVFHHPAVVKIKSALLEGDYKDRRLVYFRNKAEAEKNKKELSKIIKEIIKSIDNQ